MNRVFLVGDSTCQTNDESTFPQVGWGQFFGEYLNENYEVINLALNGTSSKSFYDNGYFSACEESISEGDFLFIQFGHNDEKDDKERHTNPNSTYQEYLNKYIKVARENGAIPILMSSIMRRKFFAKLFIKNTHRNYPSSVKKLARKENVIFIDLAKITKKEFTKIGYVKSKDYFMNLGKNEYPNYPEGKDDNTHLREKGARLICELIKKESQKDETLSKLFK